MNLKEIKLAVDKGFQVHWMTDKYNVIKNDKCQYMIEQKRNDYRTSLTWEEGTIKGTENDYFVDIKHRITVFNPHPQKCYDTINKQS